jgi:hypothetical protein
VVSFFEVNYQKLIGMKKFNNPNGANEQKNTKASRKSINQGQGPEFQTEDKTFRERIAKDTTPLGDIEGLENKATRTQDHENVGGE